MPRPAADFVIERHGNLEGYVRSILRDWGWKVEEVVDIDIDAFETAERGHTVKSPGSGTIILQDPGPAGECVPFEYRLPETAAHVYADIECAVLGGKIDRDRRAGKAAPAVIGGN